MRILVVFVCFALFHGVGWAVAHGWMQKNKQETLIVFDTSFSMKPHFDDMWQWVEDYSSNSRYQQISIGTDKEALGKLDSLRSSDQVFRSAFGKFDDESLQKYTNSDADKKILLSDGDVKVKGWEVVEFD